MAKLMLVVYGFATVFLIAIAAASVAFQINIPLFTADVTAIARLHPFTGILSNLGIFLWCISASTCLFAAMILRNTKQAKYVPFLFCSGLLSAYLMLDDAFLVHEHLIPKYLGLNEKVVFLALGLSVLWYLKSFMQIILTTRYGILVLAFAFLSTSVVVDAILAPWLQQLGHWEFFIEDGAKWLGIVSWCIYFVTTSFGVAVRAYDLTEQPRVSGRTFG